MSVRVHRAVDRRYRIASLSRKALFLERGGNLRNQLTASPADISERGKHPHRRRAERDNAKRLDRVPDRPAFQEVSGERLLLRVGVLHFAHLLDEEPERRVHQVAVVAFA